MAAITELTLPILAQWANGRHFGSLNQPLRVIETLVKADIKRNFADGHNPDGVTWPPLKRPRKKRQGQRPGTDKPLRDRGILAAANTTEVLPNGLVASNNIVYGRFHQDGTRHIPQRQFLGFGQVLIGKMLNVLADFGQREATPP